MHRLATLPGDGSEQEVTLVEQPSAPVLFLTSASTDISTLSSTLLLPQKKSWNGLLRALPLSAIDHPAQIDHYLGTTANDADLILVRLLGSKGHWSYGLERLQIWQKDKSRRNLIVVSGTKEQEIELHSIGNVNIKSTERICDLLKVGGIENFSTVLDILDKILNNSIYELNDYQIEYQNDPQIWDWNIGDGPKVAVILYRALYQSGDTELAKDINNALRKNGIVPRTIWVSSLRDIKVKQNVSKILHKENVSAVITSTSFSSVESKAASSGVPLWDDLNVPVFQLLTSSQNKQMWIESSRGLAPLDLSMQIVLPELDGRITTRPCAFKNTQHAHPYLYTAIQTLKSEPQNLEWISLHVKSWIDLQNVPPSEKKITLVIANYPVRNGRLANGVGLDTPASIIEILKWLAETGHDLGSNFLPKNGNELMKDLLNYRTNDPESLNKEPLDYIDLQSYNLWWNNLPEDSKSKIIKRWGEPKEAVDLEKSGFSIHGVRYGNISILIQPSRCYDPDNIKDLHSPDLPPPHRYLAQYLWIKDIEKANVVVHVGKHGSLEWLPGKALGLSNSCYPHIAISHLPNIYPFIVNDPGEGSQAKRRSQAVIIDHLTPPLGIAGLHGDLLKLEGLMEEYYESELLSEKRAILIKDIIIELLHKNNLLGLRKEINKTEINSNEINYLFSELDSYLCEIKESQIRTGLHIFGKKPKNTVLTELLFLIAKSPSSKCEGITQWIAKELKLELDPWGDDQGELLSLNDANSIKVYSDSIFTLKGHLISWLDNQALLLLQDLIEIKDGTINKKKINKNIAKPLTKFLLNKSQPMYKYIDQELWPKLSTSTSYEKNSFIDAISGKRVVSGPSGSPTRGRHEVLPTGRNFYSIDLRGLPTEASWDLGKRSANKLLEMHLMDNGEHLKKLAISVWGTATMRNGGDEICQLLALIGVIPIWDGPTRRVVDIEVIPLSILGRPRVDVVLRISGLFRDAFPQLIEYVNKAQNLIAKLEEPIEMNPLAAALKQGKNIGRVYGSAPGAYGAGLQALLDYGQWESRSDIALAYLEWSQWRYDNNENPTKDINGLKNCLNDVQVVLHNQDNREHDILDSDDYYQFHGGLTAAVEKLSGKLPIILIGDNSRTERPRINHLSKEIDKVMRSRMLNPRWIEGMREHGYKGAFEMGASLDYLFSYDAATGAVPNWCYSEICEKWLKDSNTKEFLSSNNPWVLRDLAEKLLEANNRNMWGNANKSQIEFLKGIVNESERDIEEENYCC